MLEYIYSKIYTSYTIYILYIHIDSSSMAYTVSANDTGTYFKFAKYYDQKKITFCLAFFTQWTKARKSAILS